MILENMNDQAYAAARHSAQYQAFLSFVSVTGDGIRGAKSPIPAVSCQKRQVVDHFGAGNGETVGDLGGESPYAFCCMRDTRSTPFDISESKMLVNSVVVACLVIEAAVIFSSMLPG